jgi:hypothetical protein
MFSSAFILLALSVSAFANLFVTSPTASSTLTGGKPSNVTWQDDGKQPTLQAFGQAVFAIYTGNAVQQTYLQTISPSVDVSTTNSVTFTPDATIGPSGAEYFIRVQSLALKDPAQPQYPALAFSAKFTMNGMTGKFNATVQSEIAGQSTAPIGGGATAAASTYTPVTATPSAMATSKASSASSGSAAKTSAAAGAAKSNGANKLVDGSVTAFAGVAVAVLGGIFC